MNKLDILIKMFAAFVNARPTEATYAVYLEVLADVPREALQVIVNQVLSSPVEFPPSPGQLKDAWLRSQGKLSPVDGAARGWLAVQEALKTVPAAKLDDPIARDVVKAMGGMTAIRRSETPQYDRRDFLRLYDEMAKGVDAEDRQRTDYKALSDNSRLLEARDESSSEGD